MINFWGTQAPEPEPIPLTLPKRLGNAETVRLLGNAFDVMTAVLIDGAEIADVARQVGYTHVLSEAQTPSLVLESFAHAREEHRLILNTHSYPKYTRHGLHLTIPGGMTLEALERFRLRRACVGSTYYWHAHIYGEWRTDTTPHEDTESATSPQSPVFIELRQDVFQGEPLLLRVVFHRLSARTKILSDA
jgi:hypothetical protein